MGLATLRHKKRQRAKEILHGILDKAENVIVIHYSCESFYDLPAGTSPRITSIAVRNLDTAQTTSFSIHQIAERQNLSGPEIERKYNDLEHDMLKEFYDYVKAHKNVRWLHWNMRDINYGFKAIEHRFKVLGGDPEEIDESKLVDFARLLIDLYSPVYASHPRLASLIEMNSISDKDFLTGAQEAEAFVSQNYVRLHQSTLRKVDILSNIAGRLEAGTLKTRANWREIHGGLLGYWSELIRDHPIMVLFTLISSIASIVSLCLYFIPESK